LQKKARAQHLAALELLLESGANVGARNNDDITVVHLCVSEKKGKKQETKDQQLFFFFSSFQQILLWSF